jgi:hypothetical protein
MNGKVLDGKPEEKKALRRLRSRWEDYIRMDLREIWWEVVGWIRLNQDGDQWWAVVKRVTHLRV